MLARTAALVALVLAGCASTQRNLDNYKMTRPGEAPLYVGTSQSGEPVLAASHYHAMTGLATTDQDLGLEARKGALAPGMDADIVLLDGDLRVRHVYARGRCLLADGEPVAHSLFETKVQSLDPGPR